MAFQNDSLYWEDVKYIAGLEPCGNLKNKNILISGASGLIGTFLIDVLMYRNRAYGDDCRITAVVRDEGKAKERFDPYLSDPRFRLKVWDINCEMSGEDVEIDYLIHGASNTHPLAYASQPISTLITNITGTGRLLDYAVRCHAEKFLFLSSVEVYGENRGDVERFDEKYCGYIDCNTLRAGYPEGKRAGEALCQAYIQEKGLDCRIVRLARTYGPTIRRDDSKALSQFIAKGAAGEDIVLKSSGGQFYSYLYVADAVSAMLTVLFRGQKGEAYNAADLRSDITLKELASLIAGHAGTKVAFELPDEKERRGYSAATKAVMSGEKLRGLGWESHWDVREGVVRTIDIMREESKRTSSAC